ncbi:MAG: ABC transporter permease [Chloroflexia bacterium]|jgi:ABC-2 type transport system permease protein/oleandomycin transport system permease protein|nr:ABC transporter permease [Chloroflexia bacterium]MDQ3525751.1 ABC transporter permease [Chloroflexota bacterium]
MSTNTIPAPTTAPEQRVATAPDLDFVRRSRPASIITDSLIMAKRHLQKIPRQPDWLVGVTVFPIMFLLLFRYIFGDTVQATLPAGVDAVNYLVAGVIVQGIVFGALNTGLGLAMDAKEGLMDRFASLPMSRSAVVFGRILADMAITVFTTTITILVGLLVGFRPSANVAEWIAAVALMLLMAFVLAWFGAIIGLALKTVEAVNSIGFTFIFPFTFVSSTFINPDFLPSWLQGFAKNQPFTLLLDATRGLLTGFPEIGNSAWMVTLYLLIALVVLVPIALRMYERRLTQ